MEFQNLPGKVKKLEGKADETGYRGVKQAEGGSLSLKAHFNAWKGDGEFKPLLSCNQPLPLHDLPTECASQQGFWPVLPLVTSNWVNSEQMMFFSLIFCHNF